ncbi:hypothetical protein AWC11_24850 [Mycobacterium interjectum]|nr:hypothetical protein AWC11_24850 [Mycobacterium interjectum]
MQVISQVEVGVMLMGLDPLSKQQVTVAAPVCPALIEAAAIVEAEWMRLRPSSGPVRHVTRELPAPVRGRRRPHTVVTTKPTPRPGPTRRGELRIRWPVPRVWARERSPPATR